MAVWICSYFLKSKIFSAGRSQRYSRCSVVYAIRYSSYFRCIRVLNSALVGCARCTLGFRFPKKYAHQNDPLNQGNLHELKLRLKIVRYPGIEVVEKGIEIGKEKGKEIERKRGFYSVFLFLTVETVGASDKLVLAS